MEHEPYVFLNGTELLRHSAEYITYSNCTFSSCTYAEPKNQYINQLLIGQLREFHNLLSAHQVYHSVTLLFYYSGLVDEQYLNLSYVYSFWFANLSLHEISLELDLPALYCIALLDVKSFILRAGDPKCVILKQFGSYFDRVRRFIPQSTYISKMIFEFCKLDGKLCFAEKFPYLLELSLLNCSVSTEQLEGLPPLLRQLSVSGTLMQMPDLSYLEDLLELSLSSNHNLRFEVAKIGASLQTLYLEDDTIVAPLDLRGFTGLTLLSLKCSGIAQCSIMLPYDVYYLNLMNCNLKRTPNLPYKHSIRYLNLSENQLLDCDFTGFSELQNLYLNECGITVFPELRYLERLHTVSADRNDFSNCSILSQLPSYLSTLSLAGCNLTSFEMTSRLFYLRLLVIDYNRLAFLFLGFLPVKVVVSYNCWIIDYMDHHAILYALLSFHWQKNELADKMYRLTAMACNLNSKRQELSRLID